jgi:hypothetical protein
MVEPDSTSARTAGEPRLPMWLASDYAPPNIQTGMPSLAGFVGEVVVDVGARGSAARS